jgi:hypothetical protein
MKTDHRIDYVPVENASQVTDDIIAFLQENCTGCLRLKDPHALERFSVSNNTYLELGGRELNPLESGREINVECTIHIHEKPTTDDMVEDPNGDMWFYHSMSAGVSWPAYCAAPSQIARLRGDLISATCHLSERFDLQFAKIVIWTRGQTRAEREAEELRVRRNATQLHVAFAIKDAIHSSCRGMRVGDERTLSAPVVILGIVEGDYDVALEKKEYRVCVFKPQHSVSMLVNFRRVK